MTASAPGAVGRHLVLVGFMGAGKTTIGREVARLTERPFVDVDEEIVAAHGSIAELFRDGEPGFRGIEEEASADALARVEPSVVALGGGALGAAATRARCRERGFTVLLDVDPAEAWRRVAGSDRPLGQSEEEFHRLYAERIPLYREAADAVAGDVDGVLLALLAIEVAGGALGELETGVPVAGGVALVGDATVLELHPPPLVARVHPVPPGEAAKTVAIAERLWNELRIGRDGTIVGYGGGSTTDVAGFVAATYARGVRWLAVPTTLVGQVDAAIGGKVGIDLPVGKNLVGAFHLPARVVVDPELLATLPRRERRQGMAEIVKTGLLADRAVWELAEEDMIRACAAFKAAVVVSDPYETGRRAILNLGHTFGHALEAASDYSLPHGDAVALGLLAALRLSGRPTDVVEELLRPEPVGVDRERAWAALKRDKKAAGARTQLVLLPAPGEPQFGVELPDREVRAALDALIRD
ncbi:MAG: bifunctional shikimate kinase/3-dehydroquinate synthase [Thermoleophilia bacterium]|nr:bifunctional shikimate kinase/3-dehydroquinate synthase [Thermoleophilia bacterium]